MNRLFSLNCAILTILYLTCASAATQTRPVPGSKYSEYRNGTSTPMGHTLYGTSRGLACLRIFDRSEVKDDVQFEMTCPISFLACEISTCGAEPSTYRSNYRGEQYYGRALIRLDSGKIFTIFVAGYDECGHNGMTGLPMKNSWISGCNLSYDDKVAEIANNTAEKLQKMRASSWGK